MNPNDPTKSLTPDGLAQQLFDAALRQFKGDERAASMLVISLLTEALIFSISMSVGDNEVACKGLLKHVGETIIAAQQHPLTKVPPGKPFNKP